MTHVTEIAANANLRLKASFSSTRFGRLYLDERVEVGDMEDQKGGNVWMDHGERKDAKVIRPRGGSQSAKTLAKTCQKNSVQSRASRLNQDHLNIMSS